VEGESPVSSVDRAVTRAVAATSSSSVREAVSLGP
jgi:hypothetical protein